MKKYILLFISLLFVLSANSDAMMLIGGRPAAVCTETYAPAGLTTDANHAVGFGGVDFHGVTYIPASDVTICRIDLYIGGIAGTPTSGHHYHIRIFTYNTGTTAVDSIVATSDAVNGDTLSATTYASFIFSSPPTLTGEANYAITWFLDTDSDLTDDPEYDNTNYFNARYDNELGSDGVMTGRGAWIWDSSIPYSADFIDADDMLDMKVFTQ